MYDMRLIATDRATRQADIVPTTSMDWANPLNDTATISVTVPTVVHDDDPARARVIADLLNTHEVTVQVKAPGGQWVEPPGARLVILSDDSDSFATDGAVSSTGQGVDFDLTGLPNMEPDKNLNNDGQWTFPLGTSAGMYLLSYLELGQKYGAASQIVTDFSRSKDSAGQPWAMGVKMGLRPEITMRQLLDSLATQGLIDWRMQGNTLQVFNADTGMRRDKRSVELMSGREVVGAPNQRSTSGRIDRVIVVGDKGLFLNYSRPGGVASTRGLRAAINAQGGVSDAGTATLLAQSQIRSGDMLREQLTREIVTHDGCMFFPYVHYLPGDVILAPDLNGELRELRVYQITLSKDASGVVTGSVMLGDRFLEEQVRTSRRMNGIIGGSTISGGTNAQPLPIEQSARPPAAPRNLVVQVATYSPQQPQVRGVATAQWDEVTKTTEGTATSISTYEVRARDNKKVNQPWQSWGTSAEPRLARSPLDIGSEWQVQVRATTQQGVTGDWSAATIVKVEDDKTPPLQPSRPVLATSMGTVTVSHDWRDYNGNACAPDTSYVKVMNGATEVGRIFWPDASTIIVSKGGATLNLTLVAVDAWGNASGDSAPASVTVVSVVSADLDKTVNDAIAAAKQAADEAGKQVRRSYTGNTTPSNPLDGEIWFRDSDQAILRYNAQQAKWLPMGITADDTKSVNASVLRGQITSNQLADNAVLASKIAAGQVGVDQIADSAITGAKLGPNAVTATKIADNAITTGKIAANAVVATNIVGGTITGDKLMANTITGNEIAANTITAGNLGAESVTARAIKANTITGNEIAASTITGGNIVGDTITAAQIATDAITASELKAGAVTAGKLAADSVLAGNIKAGEIETRHMKAESIAADRLVAGSITGKQITADAIDGKKLTGTNITGGFITTDARAYRGIEMRGANNDMVVFDSAGVQRIRLDGNNGSADFTGNVSITGNLTLGNNLIGANALREQVWADAKSVFASNYDLFPIREWKGVAVAGIPWPPWATKAAVFASATWMHEAAVLNTWDNDPWSAGRIRTAFGIGPVVAPREAQFGSDQAGARLMRSGTTAFSGIQYNDGRFPDVWAWVDLVAHMGEAAMQRRWNEASVNITAIFMRG